MVKEGNNLKFLDCNIRVGKPNCVSGWRIYRPDEIENSARKCGIEKGMAFCSSALELHPLDGNEEIDEICRESSFYLPVWVVMPNHTGEFHDPEKLASELRTNGVCAVRLAPKYNTLSYSLSEWCCGELLSMLEQCGIPALLDADQVGWNEVDGVCSRHPKLPLIITNLYYRQARYVAALLKKHPNLFLETSGLKSFGLLQSLCEHVGAQQLLFGSNLGVFSPGSAVCLVSYALISEKEKEEIAFRNLERLLGRKLVT